MNTAVIVRHKVRDYDAWLPLFEEHGTVRRQYGGIGDQVYRVDGDPNDLIVINFFADLERAKAFTQDPSLREVMGRAGVISDPQVTFAVEAEEATYPVAVA